MVWKMHKSIAAQQEVVVIAYKSYGIAEIPAITWHWFKMFKYCPVGWVNLKSKLLWRIPICCQTLQAVSSGKTRN